MKTASWTLLVLASIIAFTQANSQVPTDPCLGYLQGGGDPDRYEECRNDQLDDASEEVGLLCEVASYVGGGRVATRFVRYAIGQSCPDNSLAYAEAAAWRAAQDALARRLQCLKSPYHTWENGACVLARCNAGQTLSNGACVPTPSYQGPNDGEEGDDYDEHEEPGDDSNDIEFEEPDHGEPDVNIEECDDSACGGEL